MKIKPSQKPGRVVVELNEKDPRLLVEEERSQGSRESPFRLRQILVPIDFSDCSRKALQYAIPFAKQFEAELNLIHVVEIQYGGGEFGLVDVPVLENRMRESAEKQLQELAAKAKQELIPTRTIVRAGHAVQEITEAAKSLEIDLIIISTHGHTGLKHVFLGSTTENVVRYAPCPVLTVREHEHDFIAEPKPQP